MTLLLAEGEIESGLAHQIASGQRRIRGHLVAQSLAFHLMAPELAQLKGWRIQRIAVHQHCRRSDIGSQMVAEVIKNGLKHKVDYLSSSFSASNDLVPFWIKNDFRPLRFGWKKDPCSGCHHLLMVRLLTDTYSEQWLKLEHRFYQLMRMVLDNQLRHFDTAIIYQLWRLFTGSDRVLVAPCELNEVQLFIAGQRQLDDALLSLHHLLDWSIAHSDEINLIGKEELFEPLISYFWQLKNLSEWADKYQLSGKKEAINILRDKVRILFELYSNAPEVKSHE